MTIRILSLEDWDGNIPIDEMVELWNNTLYSEFPLHTSLFSRNVVHSPYVNRKRSSILLHGDNVIGFIIAKSDPLQKLQKDKNKKTLWISCMIIHPSYQRRGYGSKLLEFALADSLNFHECHVGSDPHHFFPGIPNHLHGVKEFFQANRFTLSGAAFDLYCDISSQQYQRSIRDEYRVRRFLQTEQEQLLQLIKSQFSPRWYEDTKWSLAQEKSITSMIGLFHNEEIIGFTHVHSKDDSFWIPSVYWKKHLRPSVGGLGPIGIAEQYRGKGIGTYFMIESLLILQEEGVKEMEIDWTILTDFYGKFHFKPHRSYIHAVIDKL